MPRLSRSLLVATVAAAGLAVPITTYADATDCTVDAILVNSCRPWLGARANDYPDVSSDLRAQTLYGAHDQPGLRIRYDDQGNSDPAEQAAYRDFATAIKPS